MMGLPCSRERTEFDGGIAMFIREQTELMIKEVESALWDCIINDGIAMFVGIDDGIGWDCHVCERMMGLPCS